MNPSSKEKPGSSSPSSAGEQLPATPNSKEADPGKKSEQVVSAPEKVGNTIASPPISTSPSGPLPTKPAISLTDPQTDVSSTSPTTTPSLLDDSDLIEKEWVNKARKIVEHNRDDPHRQSEEITVVKADYM